MHRIGTLTVGGITFNTANITADFYTNITEVGGATGQLIHIPGFGCQEEEFTSVGTVGKVVLVKNGGCDKSTKTFNGLQGNALAVVLYDETG